MEVPHIPFWLPKVTGVGCRSLVPGEHTTTCGGLYVALERSAARFRYNTFGRSDHHVRRLDTSRDTHPRHCQSESRRSPGRDAVGTVASRSCSCRSVDGSLPAAADISGLRPVVGVRKMACQD